MPRRDAVVWAAVAIVMAGPALAQQAETVRIDGSSTVYPVTEAFAEEFQSDFRGQYQVTVGVSGTGGGFQRFCRGETHISNASRPISQSEREACEQAGIEFIELPIAMDALAVVINPQNDWVDHLTVEELRRMWEPESQEQVTNWSQIREGFPDRPLALFAPGVDSGTFDYFTEAVVGEAHSSRGDFTASEDDNILVQGVASDPNALAYFGLAYYTENQDRLKAVPIVNEQGEAVEPSIENAMNGSYNPLSRPLFIYVSTQAIDQSEAVRQFVNYYLDPELAPELVAEVGYVPLPETAYQMAMENLENRVTGSAFEGGGSQVGMTIEDVLATARQRAGTN
ncbi:PstS family phosphate ABC transporter substrate-binding protein [Telmatospirillum sp. J64-1]|uniref:PstS family phosphate ABC transporter substrate-binding protein n=1 Tax=Telmatospirillum sp. J64-1 TaxID=2502183 RepID=UPI00115E0FF1|nr:PstS family phosphate ABC transporter substrate-binding protein [Telmatospirillum sp. J64-1]